MTNSNFTLIKSAVVNGINIDCYAQEGNNQPGESFWLSREQIGRLLEYEDPMRSIRRLHSRNKKRLDKFSSVVNLTTVEGNRTVTRSMTVYNFKGLLEICRFSNQPKANEVINKLWDIAEEIRRTGFYAVPAVQSQIDALREENSLLREQISLLSKQIEAERSFTILGQAITTISGAVSAGEAAKIFAQRGFKIGQNRLLKKCRDKNILCKRKGRQWNQPTQKAIEKGYCCIALNIGSKATTLFTPKGLQLFSDWLAEENYPIIALIEKGA